MEQGQEPVGDNPIQHRLMSSAETSAYLGVSLNTLQKWRSRNIGPKYLKYGGSNSSAIRYIQEDVEKFRNAHTVHPSNSGG
jgi:predicted DNA-binding transcriptional regulator AlpA